MRLGLGHQGAAAKMRDFKHALGLCGRDVLNLRGAISYGDYCFITGTTVSDNIQWQSAKMPQADGQSANADNHGTI